MAVHVRDGLAGYFAAIHTDVVGIRRIALVQPGFCLVDQLHDGGLLLLGKAEPVVGVAFGDDQQVAGGDGEFVLSDIGQFVMHCCAISQCVWHGTKWAIRH